MDINIIYDPFFLFCGHHVWRLNNDSTETSPSFIVCTVICLDWCRAKCAGCFFMSVSFSNIFFSVKRFYHYACKERKIKTMESVKFLGHSALDWDFMNPHAITFTILLSFSTIYSPTIHSTMWPRVHNIHMRASTYSNTCLHVHTHFYLNPSSQFFFLIFISQTLFYSKLQAHYG